MMLVTVVTAADSRKDWLARYAAIHTEFYMACSASSHTMAFI